MIDYPPGAPCWARGAAAYLEEQLTGDEVAFEWGGGASSIWLATKIRYLYVMETDPVWADTIANGTGSNCGLWIREHDHPDYIGQARQVRPAPTMWLIDGYQRIGCLELVRELAKEGDLVVLDDALDYAEPLQKETTWDIRRHAQKHPHAGTPIGVKMRRLGNTTRMMHARTKETWVCRV